MFAFQTSFSFSYLFFCDLYLVALKRAVFIILFHSRVHAEKQQIQRSARLKASSQSDSSEL